MIPMPNYLELESTTTIPTGGTLITTVYEDTDGDGLAENTDSVTLSTGNVRNAIGPFSCDPSNDVWWKSEIRNPNETVNTVIDSIGLTELELKSISYTLAQPTISFSITQPSITITIED